MGKDHSCKILLKELGVKGERIAFADEVKKDLDAMVRDKLGFSAYTEDPKEKAIIRPLMVSWGTEVMRAQNPDYWIQRVMHEAHCWDMPVCVITDVRYTNEAKFCLDNGILIDIDADVPYVNEQERINSPKVRELASYRIWNDMNHENLKAQLARIISNHPQIKT